MQVSETGVRCAVGKTDVFEVGWACMRDQRSGRSLRGL